MRVSMEIVLSAAVLVLVIVIGFVISLSITITSTGYLRRPEHEHGAK